MVKKFVGVPKEVIIESGGYILPRGTIAGRLRDGLTGLDIRQDWKVPTLHHFTWESPIQLVRALPVDAPSSRDVALGIMGALFLYDFLFFLPHIAMHKVSKPQLWCGAVNAENVGAVVMGIPCPASPTL